MATSIPQLINKAFAGNAAADIDKRAKSAADSVEAKLRAEMDSKLAQKVDITAFTDYTTHAASNPDTGGTGGAVNVVDNGDGTLTIG